MNNRTRNDFAIYGLEILKYAVLDVLYKQRASGRNLLRIHISVHLDLPTPGPYTAFNADLIGGVLWHLEEAGYVECTGGLRWRITEEGIVFIEGNTQN